MFYIRDRRSPRLGRSVNSEQVGYKMALDFLFAKIWNESIQQSFHQHEKELSTMDSMKYLAYCTVQWLP